MRAYGRRTPAVLAAALMQVACGDRPDVHGHEPTIVPAERHEIRPIELSPPEDRERSPYTGWTRAHYESVFARLLLGFVDHSSAGRARTRYHGGERLPAAMEGATRMLPALGAWLACPCNPDRVLIDGRELDIAAIARAIVVAGTDPTSPDYWGAIQPGWDQRVVEASSVAQFLLRSRARVWDRLDAVEQARIMAWLVPAEQPLGANWLAFQVARNSARAALGWPYPESALHEQLDRIERDYVGDGFYRDAHEHRVDWYNSFVVHPELSFWRGVALELELEPARVERVAERTRAFLGHLVHAFDRDGRVAPLGRSLAYRSAVLASVHASVLVGDEFLEPGLARRLSAGNLRFHDHSGMFAEDLTLTRGYHGEQPQVIENYLRPGSQYFFSRALEVLALAPDHPFWTAPEQPLPADLGDFVHAIPAIGWMLEHDAEGAGLILHNAGSSTAKAAQRDKYNKLGYPAQTWFAAGSHDATMTLADPGSASTRRLDPSAHAVAPGFAWLRYGVTQSPAHSDTVSTAVLRDPGWAGPTSLRLSCVSPNPAAPTHAFEGSYAIALGPTPRRHEGESWRYLDSGEPSPTQGAGAVLLANLHGWERLDFETRAGQHVLGEAAGFVGFGVERALTEPRCFASLQRLAASPFDPATILTGAPTVRFEGTQAWITDFAGTQAWLELGDAERERTVELGPLRASGPLRLVWVGAIAGGRRIVAVGLRELADELGPLIEAFDGPRSLACEWGAEGLRCELDGPILLRRPDAGPLTLRSRDAIGIDSKPSTIELDPARSTWIPIHVELGEVGLELVEVF